MEKKRTVKILKKTVVRGKSRGKTGVNDPVLKTLSEELNGLIPQLDEEGLRFLIQQAQVHLYNMQVEALNQNIIREQALPKPKKPASPKTGLGIKSGESKDSYYLSYGNDWVMFTDTEMLSLARIASGPDSEPERAERIYRWLERERMDVFGTVPIKDKFSPILKDFVKLLKKTFKVRYS